MRWLRLVTVAVCYWLLLTTSTVLANPLAEWRMDELSWNGTQGEVLDSSGFNRHGTARNGLTTREGILCQGGDFRGEGFTADPNNSFFPAQYYIEAPGGSALSPHVASVGSAITINGWFNTRRNNGFQAIIHKGDGDGTQDYRVYLIDRELYIDVWDINGNTRQFRVVTTLQTNTNYFFAVSLRRQSRGCGFLGLLSCQDVFVAVELFTEASDTPVIARSTVLADFNIAGKNTTGNIFIGATKFGTNNITNYFDGLIDELRIYSGVRTRQQNITDKNATRSCTIAPPANLNCLNEDFTNQANFNRIWQVLNQSGNFTPTINSGTLRLTQSTNQATILALRRIFPAADNFVQVEFDFNAYGGNLFDGSQGGDGIAVVLSDAEAPLRAGSFGGALGYAQRDNGTLGFSAGWLGIGLDVFGNFSRANEGKVGGFAANTSLATTRNRVVVRGSEQSQYAFITTSEQLSPGSSIAGSTRGPGHRYRITLDSRQAGRALLTVERNTGTGFVTVVSERNVLADLGGTQGNVPANLRLSFTGSTGGAFNIQELDNVVICAARASGGVQIDHIRLIHPQTQVSCVDASLELTACLNDNCSEVLSSPGNVRLQSSAGSFTGAAVSNVSGQNATITFSDGQAVAGLRGPVQGIAELNLISTTPELANFGDLRCFSGGVRSNCQIQFVMAGLIFVNPADNQSPLPNGHAGIDYPGRLRAVRTNTTTGACEARLTEPRAVQLGLECANPTSCVNDQQFILNGINLAKNNAGNSANRSAVTLNFNAQGAADFNYRYSDVGSVRLHATLSLPAEDEGPAVNLTGTSNNFVIRPHTLTFLEASQIPFVANSNPGTTNSGSGFWPAGRPFRLIAEPRNAQGQRTPNFGNETPAQRLTAEYAELVYPAAGIGNAALFTAGNFEPVVNANDFPGRQGSSGAIWQEAGTIRLRIGLINNNYLGTGDALNKPVSGNIGRFYPAALALTEASTQPACHSGFSYMAQPAIALNYQLQALGDPASGSRLLQNYDSGLYTGTAQFAVVAKNTTLGNERLNLGDRLVVNSGTWQSGIYQVIQSDLRFNRQSNQQPDGPFADLQLGLQVVSELDNRPLLNPDFNAGLSGSCGANCNALRLGNTLALRYGRLVLDNAFGPELDALPLSLRAEFWNGQRFIENTLDSCTPVDVANLIQLSGAVNPVRSGTAAALQQGRSSPLALLLAPSGVSAQLSYQYNGPPWLTFNWDGSANYNQQPQNEVIFGRFRGNPRLIFWREQ